MTTVGSPEAYTHGMVWLKSFTLAIKLVKCRERVMSFYFFLSEGLLDCE